MALDAPKPSRVSLLTLRILVIIVFPTAMFFIGLLHLDQYRATVLESELDALYRQGNTLARTIGLADAEYSVQAQRRISELTIHRAQQLIASIPDARIRIFPTQWHNDHRQRRWRWVVSAKHQSHPAR